MKGIILVITLIVVHYNTCGQTINTNYTEGIAYQKKGKTLKAIRKIETALKEAQSNDNISLEMDCHLTLAELKNNLIYYKEALVHYEAFANLYKQLAKEKTDILLDSIVDLESTVSWSEDEISAQNKSLDSLSAIQLKIALSNSELALDNQKKENELKQLEIRRNLTLFLTVLFALLILFILIIYRRKVQTNKTLRIKNEAVLAAKAESEKLLLNILPKSIAKELKQHGKTRSRLHEQTTVMFTDFKGFTQFSEKHTPEEIVAAMDFYFSKFDAIMEKYGIEKIKTIGDAYLCVSGIPTADPNHIQSMLLAAKEIKLFMEQVHAVKGIKDRVNLNIRIGIHTGPLVAGVVGSKKFAYDVWGDTVNIAARMEASGVVGHINVSETIYKKAKPHFKFDYRGEIDAKNKGKLKMYFLT
ncbi:hypothetical protein DNU06_06650 [Putridiphycobacter roseus]|uniref:Guanylate cyclase domain-containing protein n=1 Tax=Putridiphycobacter roseus TaxID=2219161 RepID=A0A2W1NPE5_9FLAO|nr:adenylate/guanylate cyclase domain-containing protein [Putridiphycobacter roseus]PZE17502.1 hypothetical protein DNU06_06650 [Putridiphycobacter roseus]